MLNLSPTCGVLIPRLLLIVFALTNCQLSVSAQDFHLRAPGPNGPLVLPYESWSQMTFTVVNQSDDDAEVLVTTYFDVAPDRQYGRRLWVPAHSARRASSLVKSPAPQEFTDGTQVLDMQSLVLRSDGGTERVIATDQGRRQYPHHSRFSRQVSPRMLFKQPDDSQIVSMMDAINEGGNEEFHLHVQGDFPEYEVAYDGFSHIVLATPRIAESALATEALRRWVGSGGQLWVQLERTGADVLEQLMTNGMGLVVVDEVELNRYEVSAVALGQLDSSAADLETPVRMLRVVPQGGTVLATIDGWPVAVEFPVADGRILVTTAESSVFFRQLTIRERAGNLRAQPSRIGALLGSHFFQTGVEVVPVEPAWEEIAQSYIGERIPQRWQVATLLGGFCLLLVLGGVVALRVGNYSSFAMYSPVAAMVVAGVLLALGVSSRQGIPSTRGTIQVLRGDAQGHISVTGAETIYADRSSLDAVEIQERGHYEFSGDLPGAAKRFLLTDQGGQLIENVSWTSGSLTGRYSFAKSGQPATASIALSGETLQGTLTGLVPEQSVEGVLLFPGGGRCAVTVGDDGTLRGRVTDVLRPGVYFQSELLTDRQKMQIEFYNKWLAGNRGQPTQGWLYYWDAPVELQTGGPAVERQVGDALHAVPIEIQPVETGTEVTLSPAIVHYRSIVHPRWGSTTIYENRTRQWNESTSNSSRTTLRCSIPQELSQLDIRHLDVLLDLRVPNRTLKCFVLREDGEDVEIASFDSPVGRKTLTIDDPELIGKQAHNILTLVLYVGPNKEQIDLQDINQGNSGWMIENVRVEGVAVGL